jgi:hypothetical protein
MKLLKANGLMESKRVQEAIGLLKVVIHSRVNSLMEGDLERGFLNGPTETHMRVCFWMVRGLEEVFLSGPVEVFTKGTL